MNQQSSTFTERESLDALLDANRRALVDRVRGLSEDEARRRLVPSLTTPISLIKHTAAAERIWFQRFWGGLDEFGCDGYASRDEGTFTVTDNETVESVIAELEAASQLSRIISSRFDLDDTTHTDDEGALSMRATLLTMIVEFARHAGHADILREQIDAV
ncbi:mini-circle protein [Rhodococcus sp. 05-2255-1e]|uniref:DinB family protein n=1 Tax=Rhodococcus sp. 05-2255-1e TaxID=2022495 RepID=UPI000B9B2225|nr:DinB family protein [Rhodococcus sp. 05-2255-1e]OZE28283.1 mini-circle protein [Rhodococcus sp. 05-2255-1e]